MEEILRQAPVQQHGKVEGNRDGDEEGDGDDSNRDNSTNQL